MKFSIILCLLTLFIANTYASSSDEETVCYVEKKLCRHCHHYHEKHFHIDELSNLKLKGKLEFNYRAASVADSSVENEHVQSFKKVLKKISKQLVVIDRHTSHFSVKLDLSENYLSDQSISELVTFLEGNSILRNHLKRLNISNNKVTEGSFSDIEKILNLCPKAKINLSFNSITSRNFKERFSNYLDRLSFKAY